MRYCADTWFILELFSKNSKAIAIVEKTINGKDMIVIPLTVYAEAAKKLMQRGISKEKILEFLENTEASKKIILLVPDKAIALEAAIVSLTHALSLMDSFIAATAKCSQCDVLLTADDDFSTLRKKGYLKLMGWQ